MHRFVPGETSSCRHKKLGPPRQKLIHVPRKIQIQALDYTVQTLDYIIQSMDYKIQGMN